VQKRQARSDRARAVSRVVRIAAHQNQPTVELETNIISESCRLTSRERKIDRNQRVVPPFKFFPRLLRASETLHRTWSWAR
jgi:hypothetical protein